MDVFGDTVYMQFQYSVSTIWTLTKPCIKERHHMNKYPVANLRKTDSIPSAKESKQH